MSNLSDLYSDKEYCFSELREARRIFTDKSLFTEEMAERLQKGLSFMYLYCPSEIQDTVISHIEEIERRSSLCFRNGF